MYRPSGYFSESYGKDIDLIRHREHWILVTALIVFFASVVFFAGNYLLGVINLILISIISVLGLQILSGFAGQISVGHAAFMAVGAYSSAILSTKGTPVPISILIASVLTGGLGFLIGWPSIRIKGFYLMMTTFAAQIIIIWAIRNPLAIITRGPLGHPAPSPRLFGYVLSGDRAWFVCLSLVLCAATIAALNLKRSKAGRALIAIRDNDLAAEVMGINLRNYKLFAFFIACIYAGLAGALYAHWQNSAVPEGFDLMKSIWFLGYIVVGGGGSIVGCYFGTTFFILLEEALMLIFSYLGNLNPSWLATIAPGKSIIFGGIIALFLIYEPRGLASRWEIIKSYYQTWPFPYIRGN